MNDRALPLRRLVLFLLFLCGVLAAITAIHFVKARSSFPGWFSPIFLGGMLLFVGLIAFQVWAAARPCDATLAGGGLEPRWIWVMLVASVFCTSSLHQFAPFRPDIVQQWSLLPPSLKFIKFNLILTATALAAVAALAACWFGGRRRLASTGLLILAGMMLIPNDDCRNAFNLPWIAWFGASPLMFLGNCVVLLIGYCALHCVLPRISVVTMGIINAGVFLLGLGHLTRVVW